MSLRLLNEFRNLHFRTYEGALIIRTEDNLLLNHLKNFIFQKTGLMATVKVFNGMPQIKYDNFDMRDWYNIANELKENNLGNIKTGTVNFPGAHFDSHAIQNSEIAIPYSDVGRVFVNPSNRAMTIVTKNDHMGFLIEGIDNETMNKYMKAIRKYLPDAYPWVAQVFEKANAKVEKEVAEVVNTGGFYRLILLDSEKTVRTSKSEEEIDRMCRVIYGEKFVNVTPVEHVFEDFDEIVKDHNRKVAERMKELESLRLL